jgi:metal-responsive CopG/Arc/MetJ family transcriptional regulator
MKTTISIPKDLLEEIEKVAKERRSSRDEVFVAAMREYFERRKERNCLK